MLDELICLSVPNFCGNEKKYVDEAIDTEWVSTGGDFINRFEVELAKRAGVPQACPVSPGRRGCICVSGILVLVRGISYWSPR